MCIIREVKSRKSRLLIADLYGIYCTEGVCFLPHQPTKDIQTNALQILTLSENVVAVLY